MSTWTTLSWTYLAYILLSLGLTVIVARSLSRSGKRFLVDVFHGDEGLAGSVNQMLVTGFYLINAGYALLVMRSSKQIHGLQSGLELLSSKIGAVLLVLGCLHLINLGVLHNCRERGLRGDPKPPAEPSTSTPSQAFLRAFSAQPAVAPNPSAD